MPSYATPRRSPTPRRSRRSLYRSLPVWLQWFIPFAVAAAAIVALVVWIHHETYDAPAEAPVTNPKAIVEQNREADILMHQQEAPHSLALAGSLTPEKGIHAAVLAYMRGQVSRGILDGPITRTHCAADAGATSAGRQVFRCSVVSANVTYPFEGAVRPSTHTITYCRIDLPPIPSMKIPLSTRCT